MGKEELELRKKYLKDLLAAYRRMSELSGIGFGEQEGTIDNVLDSINELSKEIDNLKKK